MSRTASFTRSAVAQIKIITPNWYAGETAPGSTATLTASVEYPAGTFTQLKWSGVASVTIADGGQATSDYASVSIPTNTQFWIRQYFLSTAGVLWEGYQGYNLTLGDAFVHGNSGVADQTMSGTVTDDGSGAAFYPLAIIAPITASSVCGYVDSIMLGVDNEHSQNSVGDTGEVMPSIGPSFGYSNMGVNADTVSAFISKHTNRIAVGALCSHWIMNGGTNDIYLNGDSAATLEGNLTTFYGYATGQTIFQTTLIPRTTSTDSWATTGNQATITGETSRVTFNSNLTSASFGPNGGYFDPGSVVGTGTNNSLWKAGGTCTTWTEDGVHPNPCSYYTALQGSGYIDLSRIHRP